MLKKSIGLRQTHRRASRSFIAAICVLVTLNLIVLAPTPAAAASNPVVAISSSDTQAQILAKAATVTPSPRQLAWQREELTGFVHFGPNTFTGKEWGSGLEDPDVFNPSNLDTDQWAATFKDAGFKKMILTAKHHDGMLLFPSAYSNYGVASSTWQNGQGDVLKAFTDSAREYGLKVGFYLSPADGHEFETRATTGRYGNGSVPTASRIPTIGNGNGTIFNFTVDDYNRYYMNTMYEVLTRYGKVDEVWLDGANPWSGQVTQNYNFKDWITMIRTLQPDAVVFQDGGPDARWVGNEAGLTHRTSEWSPLPYHTDYAGNPADPATAADMVLRVPDGNQAQDLGSDAVLGRQSNGSSSSWKLLRWAPAECDGRLQDPSWFWDPNAQPVSLSTLQNMYYNSVGKNCQLLLNVAPDNTGRFPAAAVSRMREFGNWIRSIHATNATAGAIAGNDAGTSHTTGNGPGNVLDANDATSWQPTATTGGLVLDLGAAKTFNVVNLQENIQVGQRVQAFAVDAWDGATWQQIASATTIGYRRLLTLPSPVTATKVRLRITASRALPPAIATFALHQDGPAGPTGPIVGLAGKCLDVNGGQTADGTQIQIFDCNGSAAQRWTWYEQTFRALGKCLDVNGASTSNGAKIQLWTCNGTGAQFWTPQADGSLINPNSGKCLDVEGGNPASGTKVLLWTCHGGVNQKWTLPPLWATQSSNLHSGSFAARAVDGNTNGNYSAGSVTHTSDNPLDTNPWWQVDLGFSRSVGSIKLWNRTDCCSDRLRQFYIFASDPPFTSTDPQTTAGQSGVWSSYQSAAVGTSLTLTIGRTARYIRVQLVGSDRPLSLAEVQVFG